MANSRAPPAMSSSGQTGKGRGAAPEVMPSRVVTSRTPLRQRRALGRGPAAPQQVGAYQDEGDRDHHARDRAREQDDREDDQGGEGGVERPALPALALGQEVEQAERGGDAQEEEPCGVDAREARVEPGHQRQRQQDAGGDDRPPALAAGEVDGGEAEAEDAEAVDRKSVG